ncbi:MAG TPA: hypothetical protein VH542_09805 [Steroidobacteraceae bacterium]|jgi:hypothetical protein
MSHIHIIRSLLSVALLVCAFGHSQARAGSCTGVTCAEAKTFVANVTDFRTSASGRWKIITMTVHFQSKASTPLILGYVSGSGIAIDDQGNRYAVGAETNVRGIGLISGKTFDSKFTLQPGESGDARFEMGFVPNANSILGTRFDIDLAIREINTVAADQYRLGAEHALHFARLDQNVVAAAGTPAPAAAPASTAPTTGAAPAVAGAAAAGTATAPASGTAPAPLTDPCAGAARCASGGPFVAQVSQLTAGPVGNARHHLLTITMKFLNVSSQPLILAYKTGSSGAIDNLGNRYAWGRPGTHDTSSQGIGIVEGNRADPQFTLQPGESRQATFGVIRYNSGNQQLGTAWNYSLIVDQLEILPSQQIRTVRDHSLSFNNLSTNMPDVPLPGAAASSGTAPPATAETLATEVTKTMLDLFKKKTGTTTPSK